MCAYAFSASASGNVSTRGRTPVSALNATASSESIDEPLGQLLDRTIKNPRYFGEVALRASDDVGPAANGWLAATRVVGPSPFG